jgi:hypothetical protein
MTTSTVILGTTVYGTASGNYDGSSQDWSSDAVQAANYYWGRGSVQTIAFVLTGFVGDILLEATLDADPNSATWFETYEIIAATALTQHQVTTITGNFTWMRVRVVEFDGGTINSVIITF